MLLTKDEENMIENKQHNLDKNKKISFIFRESVIVIIHANNAYNIQLFTVKSFIEIWNRSMASLNPYENFESRYDANNAVMDAVKQSVGQ